VRVRFELDRSETRLINRGIRGKFRDLFAHALLDLGIAEFERISAIQAPICSISDSCMPRVVTEGLPRRIPPPFIGGRGSTGLNSCDGDACAVEAFRRPFP